MSTTRYGASALPTNRKNTKISYSSEFANGTSSVNTTAILTEELDCLWADIATNTPDPFTAHPIYSGFILVEATPQRRTVGLATIFFTYKCAYFGTPETSYTEQNSAREAPITEHPNFSDWAADELFDSNGQFVGFVQGSSKYGVETYTTPASIVVKTEYFTSEPADERENIGKLQNPGRDYTCDTNWKVIGSTRALAGTFWTRTTTYEWSSAGWDTDIYSAA
jgi:hypothetical protein